MQNDLVGALVKLLQDTAEVSAIAGTRVYGSELPESEQRNMPRAAIVVRASGGGVAFGQAWQEYGDRRVDVLCFGATPFAADRLWRAVNPRLKQLTREVVTVDGDDVLIHWLRSSSDALPMRDPQTDWPYTLTAYQVLAAE